MCLLSRLRKASCLLPKPGNHLGFTLQVVMQGILRLQKQVGTSVRIIHVCHMLTLLGTVNFLHGLLCFCSLVSASPSPNPRMPEHTCVILKEENMEEIGHMADSLKIVIF